MKTITILVPCYNESEVIDKLYDKVTEVMSNLPNYNYELLFINDGSKDNSLEIIKSYRAKDKRVAYVNLSRNYGKDIAMASGFQYATGDAVVIIDADLQDPPDLIPEMIKHWEDGYDDVYARRRTRNGESFMKKLTSKVYYRLLQKMTRIPLQIDTGDFRLLDRRCITALNQMREVQRYTKGMFSWIGYKKKEVLFDRPPRIAGETKYNYAAMINHAIDGIVTFTTVPLRLATILGILVSFVAFVYMIWTFIQTIFFPDTMVQGYPTIMIVMLFLGGVQLLVLGVIGEYLGRVFNETKNRPLYLVDEYNDKKI